MEVACPGAPGSAIGQQKELAKAKEKTQSLGKKQSCVYKLEAVEKSPVFCGKWDILNDVITKGTAKEGSEGSPAAISIIAQAECEGLDCCGHGAQGRACRWVADHKWRPTSRSPVKEQDQGDHTVPFSQDTLGV